MSDEPKRMAFRNGLKRHAVILREKISPLSW